ncbi:MAG: signal peptidase I [Bacteroides sp.]|nr:signal peptidase I [Bacteroides sp.]
MRKATRTQWIKCAIALVLYLAFLVWVKSWLGLIVIPFIFDIYITKIIPWSFWKKSKNPAVRSVMSWVDAIVFALIAVYFVNIYVFQNYQIPSSSLEKSMLVGDFLYVSKMSYGPRVPNTPLSMPLAQHTLPVINTKSYIEWPQWKYKRVPGFGKVKLNDIVVFNFPAGDTVALNNQMSDFYTIAYSLGQNMYPGKVDMDSLTRKQQRTVYDLYYNAGRKQILSNPKEFGEVVIRPVDRRENYVKRCVGLPGDTLQIIDGQVMIDGKATENPEDLQFNYFVQTTGPGIPEEMFRELGISKDDQMLMTDSQSWEGGLLDMGLNGRNAQGSLNPVYHLPLTKKMYNTLNGNKKLIHKIVMEPETYSGQMYPLNLHTQWNRNNYGPIWIPAKGATITLTDDNLPIYERIIRAYEGNKLEVKEDGIYINDVKTDKYTFQMDYYWMMGDNRHNSADSRYWGFVPEDHIVGKPLVVWLSLDKDRGWFDGKIRWNRLFKWVG